MSAQPSTPSSDTATHDDSEAALGTSGTADDAGDEWDIISRYTRAHAIEDGMLVDVTHTPERTEAGIKYPVAMTRAVYETCVELTPAAKRAGNDVRGRLWDVLWMMRFPVRRIDPTAHIFELFCVTDRQRPSKVQLKAVCGPGDDAEPVITIMLPDED
jgi:hypothetical protein